MTKLLNFITLLCTFLALGISLYIAMQTGILTGKQNQQTVIQDLQNQLKAEQKNDTQLKKTVDSQTQVITKYEERIKAVEKSQEDFLSLMVDKEKQTTPATTTPTTPATTTQTPTTPAPVTPVPTPTQTTPATTSSLTVSIPAGQSINVRQSGSSVAAITGSLTNGQVVVPTGESVNDGKYVWIKVKTPSGTYGWIAKIYTK